MHDTTEEITVEDLINHLKKLTGKGHRVLKGKFIDMEFLDQYLICQGKFPFDKIILGEGVNDHDK